MSRSSTLVGAAMALGLLGCRVTKDTPSDPLPDQRWSEERVAAWYQAEPWRVGANYVPRTAINQLEMWQAGSFDLPEIDEELGWAERAGLNTLRVFLHDLLWEEDEGGFRGRIDAFLGVAERHGMKAILVLFDSCWDPMPALGPQRAPRPGVHNSGWVQGPGARALADRSEWPRLERYVRGVVRSFAADPRVYAWDVWNEPDNTNSVAAAYASLEPPNKIDLVAALLPDVFEWARAEAPSQPLTSALWSGDWSTDASLSAIQRIQIVGSDVVSLHDYDGTAELDRRMTWLERFRRPLLLTEYMARPTSTIGGALPIAKSHHAAALDWGLVSGKTQTIFPWSSWTSPAPSASPPTVWFHDLFWPDGTPFAPAEIAVVRTLRGL